MPRDLSRDGPVVSAISALVEGLRPGANGNWIGYCPIHGEQPGKSKASFSFNETTGCWHCFAGCGGGGLPQLLKKLGRSGTFIDRTMERLRPFLSEVRKRAPSAATVGGLFQTPYPLPERILGLFEYVPQELVDAGFDEQVLFDNDVGVDTGRGRTTYAIRDMHGTLAGIAGKPYEGGHGKYLVYERELEEMGFKGYRFNNRRFFWRWEKVYAAVYHGGAGPVYVTEGYKACLWLVQHGFYNTVAMMGTSLSDVQQMFLERLGAQIVLCGDNDHWGRVGTEKTSYKLRGLDIAIMDYPPPSEENDKAQPDDLSEEELIAAVGQPLTRRQWRLKYEHTTRSRPSPLRAR